MTTQTKALKLAASVLKGSQEYKRGHATFVEAVEELEEALAEQPAQQEPVAYFNPQVKGGFYWAKPTKITAPVTVSVEPMPLYTTLQAQPAQQEPVAWMYKGDAEFDGNDWQYPTRVTISKQVADFHGGNVHPLYTTPQAQPAREWVGLTDDKVTNILEKCCREHNFENDSADLSLSFARAIEAKLKEKNT